jgi:hypothetical protein
VVCAENTLQVSENVTQRGKKWPKPRLQSVKKQSIWRRGDRYVFRMLYWYIVEMTECNLTDAKRIKGKGTNELRSSRKGVRWNGNKYG